MLLRFTKMHGLGNDFVLLDLITQDFQIREEQIRFLADRRIGIGFDQLLIAQPPDDPGMDFKYRIFNADGTEAEQCGNGAPLFSALCSRSWPDNQVEGSAGNQYRQHRMPA